MALFRQHFGKINLFYSNVVYSYSDGIFRPYPVCSVSKQKRNNAEVSKNPANIKFEEAGIENSHSLPLNLKCQTLQVFFSKLRPRLCGGSSGKKTLSLLADNSISGRGFFCSSNLGSLKYACRMAARLLLRKSGPGEARITRDYFLHLLFLLVVAFTTEKVKLSPIFRIVSAHCCGESFAASVLATPVYITSAALLLRAVEHTRVQ